MAKVRRLIEDETGHDPDVWREIVELGWLGIAIPEEHGGAGLGLAEVVPVMEQMGRHMLAGPFYSTTLAAQALLVGGTGDQKRVLLPRLAEGAIATLALCEPNDDWDLGNIASTATRTSMHFAVRTWLTLSWRPSTFKRPARCVNSSRHIPISNAPRAGRHCVRCLSLQRMRTIESACSTLPIIPQSSASILRLAAGLSSGCCKILRRCARPTSAHS